MAKGRRRWEREMGFGSFKQASGNLNCLVDIWCLWWARLIINNGRSKARPYSSFSVFPILHFTFSLLSSFCNSLSFFLSICLEMIRHEQHKARRWMDLKEKKCAVTKNILTCFFKVSTHFGNHRHNSLHFLKVCPVSPPLVSMPIALLGPPTATHCRVSDYLSDYLLHILSSMQYFSTLSVSSPASLSLRTPHTKRQIAVPPCSPPLSNPLVTL